MKTASRLKLIATVASVARASSRPGAPGLSERVQSVPRLVRATLDGSYAGTRPGRLALVAAAVAYVASPVDLIPESVLPVVGLADDAVVLAWATRAFVEETDRFIAWEAGQGVRYAATPGDGRHAPSSGTFRRGPVVVGQTVPSSGAWAGGDVTGAAAPRADRDVTGAATPWTARMEAKRSQATAGVRDAATAYVLESVRRRLER